MVKLIPGIGESNPLVTDLPGFHFDSENEAQMDVFSKENSYFINGCLDGGNTSKRKKSDPAVRRKIAQCPICNETLSGNKLPFHMKKYHNFNGKVCFCDNCPEVFVNRKDCDKHEETHHTDLVECDVCDLKVNRRKLNFHRNSVHFSEVKHFKCEICKENVAVAYKYNHMRTHDECLTRFTCEKCGKIYYNQYSFQKHQDAEHGIKKVFSCHICKKTFDTSEERFAHNKTHKKREKKQCPFCETSVANVLFLQHIKKHAAHEIGNDILQCPRCPRTFEKPEYTINHMVCHLDPPRPSECEFCFLPSKTAALTEKHSLREHIQEKKPKKKKATREYKQCVKCGSHLVTGEPYKRHLIDHAWNDVNVDQGDVNVTCPVCFRIFPCSMYLINHFLSHYETDRIHECERCFLSLPTTTLLAFHQSRCAGKRDYMIRKSTRQGKDKKQMTINSDVGTFAWLCSECSQMFETQEECEEHCSAMHTFEEIQC